VASAGHMQIICTSLQTDNHTSTSLLKFLQVRCSSWCPTNLITAWRQQDVDRWFINTSFKDVNITQQMTAIYPLHSAGCEPNRHSTVKTAHMSVIVSDIAIFVLKRDVKLQLTNSYIRAYHCTQRLYTIQHRTVLMIFPLILQSVIIT